MEPTQFWYFLIDGQLANGDGVIGNIYAYGQHCGEALTNALNAAKEQDFMHPEAAEATRLDNLNDFEMPDDLIRVNERAFIGPTTHSYPIDPTENNFIAPSGIIKSGQEGLEEEFDYNLIQEQFTGFQQEGCEVYEFELVVNKSRLVSTFIKAISFLPGADELQLRLQDGWEGQEAATWNNRSLSGRQAITEFLLEHQSDTLDNGFVECVICVAQGETTLVLGEHKQIKLYTKDEKLFSDFGVEIIALGFAQTTELYSLEYGFYHYHYRPAGSLSRIELQTLLATNGFVAS